MEHEEKEPEIKKYTEEDREYLQSGCTNAVQNASCMPLDDLVFWLGLGILLARKYVLKATYDKITASPPYGGEALPIWEETALLRCGWHKDTETEDDPCAWFSFHAGG